MKKARLWPGFFCGWGGVRPYTAEHGDAAKYGRTRLGADEGVSRTRLVWVSRTRHEEGGPKTA